MMLHSPKRYMSGVAKSYPPVAQIVQEEPKKPSLGGIIGAVLGAVAVVLVVAVFAPTAALVLAKVALGVLALAAMAAMTGCAARTPPGGGSPEGNVEGDANGATPSEEESKDENKLPAPSEDEPGSSEKSIEELKMEMEKIIEEFNQNKEKYANDAEVIQKYRREFRQEYADLLNEICDISHPGKYEALLKDINNASDGENTSENVAKFRKAIVEFGKLTEEYTGVPAEVFSTQACVESGNGQYGNGSEPEKEMAKKKNNNLFAALYLDKGDLKWIPFDSRELSIATYFCNFHTIEVTAANPLGRYGSLFSYGDDYENWMHHLGPVETGGTGYNGHDKNYGPDLVDFYNNTLATYFLDEE